MKPCFCLRTFIVLYAFTASRVSISFLVLGAYLGVDDSFRGGPQGVVCALANNVMTALTFLMVKKLTDRTNLSALGVCYYNSMIAFPFAVMAIFIFDEHKYLKEYTGTADEVSRMQAW